MEGKVLTKKELENTEKRVIVALPHHFHML
ncbi:hypothetical protein BGLY_1967 [Bacillus glycinifermentans]|nr:hypothetical protein BGLY_1967 [Bacillus glycinifermentans]